MCTQQNYYSLDYVDGLIEGKSLNDFFIVHLNAVSLIANFDNITNFLEKLDFPDIICYL